jgi:hypothetical protein
MKVDEFRPSYIWPNPAFPFRVYFDSEKCRIFIIENIQHNWSWLREYSENFRENDHFLVFGGWYQSPAFAVEAEAIFGLLKLRRDRFFFLFNSDIEKENFERNGFGGEVIPQNSWIDEDLIMRPLPIDKLYRAIYVARRSAFKRHMLASKVEGLALVAGINHGNVLAPLPDHVYINATPLSPDEVCQKINQSVCGLLLSAVEGASFASSEYLLCGIPVVSTPSHGGRDIWYNDYNSIVCNADPDSVAAAVSHFEKVRPDANKIRWMHIDLALKFRRRFILQLSRIFLESGVRDVDPEEYFRANFFHKMRRSYKPEFEILFSK